jgi:RNA polymerase sigma-70 factor (ECF subfamily)
MYFMCVPPAVKRTAASRIDTPPQKYLPSSMVSDAAAAVDAVYRTDWGRIVATLIGLVGDFEIAEEAAQEAFTAALDRWPSTGVPEFPRVDHPDGPAQGHRPHSPRDAIRQKLESYAASGLIRASRPRLRRHQRSPTIGFG